MRSIRSGDALIIVAVMMSGSAGLDARWQTTESSDIIGAWQNNADLTEKPAQPGGGEQRGGGRQPPGGVMPGGGMTGGGRGPGLGGPPGEGRGGKDAERMERVRAAMDAAMEVPQRVTIARSEAGIVITDGDGVSRTLTPDGKTYKSALNGQRVDVKAKWDRARLVVERSFGGGVKLTHEYAVTVHPRQLIVTTKMEGPSERRFGRRAVYDPLLN